MKELRIINACFWAVLELVLLICVYNSFYKLGYEGDHTLLIQMITFGVFPVMGWLFFDLSIKEANK